jgi:UDP-glucose 4-epimerase
MFLGNLVDATLSAAGGETAGSFIVTDSPPLSTAELYRALLRLYGRPAFVPRVPRRFVHALARVLLGDRVESLIGDSAFDGARFALLSRWTPPTDFSRALALTVENDDEALV